MYIVYSTVIYMYMTVLCNKRYKIMKKIDTLLHGKYTCTCTYTCIHTHVLCIV